VILSIIFRACKKISHERLALEKGRKQILIMANTHIKSLHHQILTILPALLIQIKLITKDLPPEIQDK